MKKYAAIIGVVMVAAAIAAAVMIVAHCGLRPGLDFGPGQYYYTDLPGWEKYFSADGLVGGCRQTVCYLAFALWGLAMYRFWRWIDRRN